MKIIYQAQNEYPEKLNNIYSSPARLYNMQTYYFLYI